MASLIIALVVILGGGATLAVADDARPGDKLYGLDLAVEKAQLSLASSEEKKEKLQAKFEEEREMELKMETKGSMNTRDMDLSNASVTEIEVDVFTNETTVKVEANDKHYGFVTDKKVRAEIVAEIAAKYNLDEDKVDMMLDFETEDRASRADDKKFLNSSASMEVKVDGKMEDKKDDNKGSSLNINVGAGLGVGGDVRESEDEVLCDGEWRDPEDCEDR